MSRFRSFISAEAMAVPANRGMKRSGEIVDRHPLRYNYSEMQVRVAPSPSSALAANSGRLCAIEFVLPTKSLERSIINKTSLAVRLGHRFPHFGTNRGDSSSFGHAYGPHRACHRRDDAVGHPPRPKGYHISTE